MRNNECASKLFALHLLTYVYAHVHQLVQIYTPYVLLLPPYISMHAHTHTYTPLTMHNYVHVHGKSTYVTVTS